MCLTRDPMRLLLEAELASPKGGVSGSVGSCPSHGCVHLRVSSFTAFSDVIAVIKMGTVLNHCASGFRGYPAAPFQMEAVTLVLISGVCRVCRCNRDPPLHGPAGGRQGCALLVGELLYDPVQQSGLPVFDPA